MSSLSGKKRGGRIPVPMHGIAKDTCLFFLKGALFKESLPNSRYVKPITFFDLLHKELLHTLKDGRESKPFLAIWSHLLARQSFPQTSNRLQTTQYSIAGLVCTYLHTHTLYCTVCCYSSCMQDCSLPTYFGRSWVRGRRRPTRRMTAAATASQTGVDRMSMTRTSTPPHPTHTKKKVDLGRLRNEFGGKEEEDTQKTEI